MSKNKNDSTYPFTVLCKITKQNYKLTVQMIIQTVKYSKNSYSYIIREEICINWL